MKAQTAILLVLLSCLSGKAQRTNELYSTEDKVDYGGSFGALASHDVLSDGTIPRERLPARDFPEGNWGPAVNGCQVSLRFAKQVYAPGETITAILLLRNVTNHTLLYPMVSGSCLRFDLQIVTRAGEPLKEKPFRGNSDDWRAYLEPGWQHKYLEGVNGCYDLTNGAYFVRLATRVAEERPLDPEEQRSRSAHEQDIVDRCKRGEITEQEASAALSLLLKDVRFPAYEWIAIKSADVPIRIEGQPDSGKP
jgi:hypothetical protein